MPRTSSLSCPISPPTSCNQKGAARGRRRGQAQVLARRSGAWVQQRSMQRAQKLHEGRNFRTAPRAHQKGQQLQPPSEVYPHTPTHPPKHTQVHTRAAPPWQCGATSRLAAAPRGPDGRAWLMPTLTQAPTRPGGTPSLAGRRPSLQGRSSGTGAAGGQQASSQARVENRALRGRARPCGAISRVRPRAAVPLHPLCTSHQQPQGHGRRLARSLAGSAPPKRRRRKGTVACPACLPA